ncbi:MAG: META domain-containing protein [Caldilineaceae bacterium]
MNDDSSTTPADPAAYTLEFAADGRVAVQADCNRGTGPYALEGNQLTFGAVAVTLMACPEGSQSDAYLQQLGQVGSYFITEDGRLVLELQVDSGSMTFIAAQ